MRTIATAALAALLLSLCSTLSAQTPAAAATESPADKDEYFNVNVSNAPAPAFFQGLVRDTRYNILIHPEVAGSITLTLRHVTVIDVLEAVKQLYGFDYRRVSTGFLILPATVQTRVFHLNYL